MRSFPTVCRTARGKQAHWREVRLRLLLRAEDQVIYATPYARYLYYGEVMGPNIPVFEDDAGTPTRFFSPPGQEKHLTGRALTFRTDSNPLAGAFWFERMKADHMQDILEEARNVANGK